MHLIYNSTLFNAIKAIHIIMVVSYFAGLFYIVRLFIYHTETQTLPDPDQQILQKQYTLMAHKLWSIIIVPAVSIVLITGLVMLVGVWNYFGNQPWMYVKLTFVLGLIAYHFWTWKTLKDLKNNIFNYTSVNLRMMNEVATLLLFLIVFTIVLKQDFVQYWYVALISFVLLGIIILGIVKIVNPQNKK